MKYLLQLVIKFNLIKALSDCILSYFGHLQNYIQNIYIKNENSSLLKKKNTREIIINHKGTRMVRDGED